MQSEVNSSANRKKDSAGSSQDHHNQAPPNEFLTRRQLFSRTASDVLHGAEWAALLAPLLFRTTIWNGAGQNSKSAKEPPTPKGPYPGTDQTEVFSNGQHFRSLGVAHVLDFYTQHSDFLKKAVEKTDVLILEDLGTTQNPNLFFRSLAEESLKIKKKVLLLDGDQIMLAGLQAEASNLLAALGGSALLCQYIDHRRKEPTWNFSRRMLLRLAVWTAACTGLPSPPVLVNSYFLDGKHYNFDVSYIVDGRTVLMLDKIRKIKAEHPHQNVLAVVGNGHAKLFAYYLRDERTRREFNIKRRIYGATYGLAYSRKPALIEVL